MPWPKLAFGPESGSSSPTIAFWPGPSGTCPAGPGGGASAGGGAASGGGGATACPPDGKPGTVTPEQPARKTATSSSEAAAAGIRDGAFGRRDVQRKGKVT